MVTCIVVRRPPCIACHEADVRSPLDCKSAARLRHPRPADGPIKLRNSTQALVGTVAYACHAISISWNRTQRALQDRRRAMVQLKAARVSDGGGAMRENVGQCCLLHTPPSRNGRRVYRGRYWPYGPWLCRRKLRGLCDCDRIPAQASRVGFRTDRPHLGSAAMSAAVRVRGRRQGEHPSTNVPPALSAPERSTCGR